MYSEERCKAFQCDLTKSDLIENVPSQSVDFCSLIFVLSAILPDNMVLALKNIHKVSGVGKGVTSYNLSLFSYLLILRKVNNSSMCMFCQGVWNELPRPLSLTMCMLEDPY